MEGRAWYITEASSILGETNPSVENLPDSFPSKKFPEEQMGLFCACRGTEDPIIDVPVSDQIEA